VGSIAYDAFTAIVSHAVRLPLGVEAQGLPEFRGICCEVDQKLVCSGCLRRSRGP